MLVLSCQILKGFLFEKKSIENVINVYLQGIKHVSANKGSTQTASLKHEKSPINHGEKVKVVSMLEAKKYLNKAICLSA